jgi:hypothetical protein
MTERRKDDERRNHLMTEQEVAERAIVSANTVRYWRQTGILPFLKVFKKPLPHLGDGTDKIPSAGDVRRQ